MSQRAANFSVLVGAMLVAFVCSIQLVTSALFTAGIPISRFHIPFASAFGAGFGWWTAAQYFPAERARVFGLALGICVVAVISATWISGSIYDPSWDGQWYHAEAILHLMNGWNPIRDTLPAGVINPTQLSFQAKGPWMLAAAMNKLTGNFETGKVFHLILILASCMFALAAISTFKGLAWPYQVIAGLALAVSPVSICQAFTYYVDGQLSSLLTTVFSLLILLDRRPDRVLMAILTLAVVLTINVKLDAPIFIGIIAVGYWVWYALAKKPRWRELAGWFTAGGVIGGCFVGFDPYISQFLTRLYSDGYRFLFTDWHSFLEIYPDYPPNFARMDRFQKLLTSLFSKSEVEFFSPPKFSQLKLPFTLSRDELRVFWAPDVRTGGFGPLFSGALLLSLTILLIAAWKYRNVLKEHIGLLVVAGLIIVSGFPNPEMWWARYVPQFWAVPSLLALVAIGTRPRLRLAQLAVVLFLTLAVNDLSIAFVSLRAARNSDQAIASQLRQLKRSGEPIAVQFNRFTTATRYRLEQEGIQFVEVSELPCARKEETTLAYSQAIICSQQLKPPVSGIISDSRSAHIN